MRELLLRLEAERSGATGRSGPATMYFRERKRHVLVRHPRFAFKYLAATRARRREAAAAWQSTNDGRRSETIAAPAPDA